MECVSLFLNSFWCHDTQHNVTQHNITQHKGLIRDTQHKGLICNTQHNNTLLLCYVIILSILIYCYAECHYAECLYAECRYAQYHYAECHYAQYNYAECRYAQCCKVSALSLTYKYWNRL